MLEIFEIFKNITKIIKINEKCIGNGFKIGIIKDRMDSYLLIEEEVYE